MTRHTDLENYFGNYDSSRRRTWRDKPADVHKLPAVRGYEGPWLYKGKGGKAMIAVGCRRFTLKEADLHWGATDRVYEDWRRSTTDNRLPGNNSDRAARAHAIVGHVLQRAHRLAAKFGYKTED